MCVLCREAKFSEQSQITHERRRSLRGTHKVNRGPGVASQLARY